MLRNTLIAIALCISACNATDPADESSDTVAMPDADDTDVEEVDATADADIVCEFGRGPRVVDGVVVEPCGCCPVDHNYCSGVAAGGRPRADGWDGCPVSSDAAPPCSEGIDQDGCPTVRCSGSCLTRPDASP